MKIAQIVCVYPPYRGGMGKIAEDYTKFLKDRNHQVAVFTPLLAGFVKEKDERDIKRLRPLLRLGNASLLPQLFFQLRGFDIIYLHYPFFGTSLVIFFLKLFQKRKFKLVIHYHMDTNDLNFFKKIFTIPDFLIRKKLFALADMVVCASLDYVKYGAIKKIYKQNLEKFKELPFTVDTDKFKPAPKVLSKKINITFVGGMDKAHSFKGVDILLKAFSLIKRDDIRLNLVGNGELIDDYKQLAKNLKIDNRVIFFTGLDDEEKIVRYQKSDIFVLPSVNSHEAFGIVLLEAMSCGVPVVASALPGVRKVFKDDKQGLFVVPGDVGDLKDKLIKLIDSQEKRKKMGSSALSLVQEKYSEKKIEEKLEKFFLSLF